MNNLNLNIFFQANIQWRGRRRVLMKYNRRGSKEIYWSLNHFITKGQPTSLQILIRRKTEDFFSELLMRMAMVFYLFLKSGKAWWRFSEQPSSSTSNADENKLSKCHFALLHNQQKIKGWRIVNFYSSFSLDDFCWHWNSILNIMRYSLRLMRMEIRVCNWVSLLRRFLP